MAQVYAVIYDEQGNFLVAKKNANGYFSNTNNGSIVKEGQPITGAEGYCFPGGKLEGADRVAGALREFLEDTNVSLNPTVFTPTPSSSYNSDGDYHGVYFKTPKDKTLYQLSDIAGFVNQTLKMGADAAQDIQGSFDGDYDALMQKYPYCPGDNELASCEVVNVNDISKYFQDGDPYTGRFYTMIMNLVTKKVITVDNQPPADGQPPANDPAVVDDNAVVAEN